MTGSDASHPQSVPSAQSGSAANAGAPFPISVAPEDLFTDPLLRALPRTTFGSHPAPILGKIPLLARLGRGAMGAVYYGVHPRLRIEVAIKVLQSFLVEQDPAVIERFYREAQTAARVRSPHLVHVSDVDEESGLFYIVMEYVRGISVAEYLKRSIAAGNTGLPEPIAVRIVLAASKGLAAAHGEGIIHRDIKPGNIMLPACKDGSGYEVDLAKLADLGLARPENPEKGLTLAFEALGTPGYMAPEQAQDAKSAGKPADVFSMGATLYALLRGRPPFTGETSMAVLSNTIREPHVPISEFRPDVSLALAAIVERCLAKEPGRRYPDGEALVAALRKCRDQYDATQAPPATGETTILSAKRTRGRATGIRRRTARIERQPAPAPAAESTVTASPLGRGISSTVYQPEPAPAPSADGRATAPAPAPVVSADTTFPPLSAGQIPKPRVYTGWPYDEREARRRRAEAARDLGLPEELCLPLPKGLALDLTLVPAGEFLMGSPQSEDCREKDEFPHYVRLTRPFYVGLHLVTQAQWHAITGINFSRFKNEPDSAARPVERVSWNDIHEKFLPALNPLAAPGWRFRLPTEAEWEYVCRAGTETPFHFGLAVSVAKINCKEDRTSGHHWKWIYSHDLVGGPKEKQETTPVGAYPPNAWGLSDTHGNVWEWCEDGYSVAFCQNPQAVDPVNADGSAGRVLRGGAWNYSARYCRAACRYHSAPDVRNFNFGFRLVCAIEL
jgi:formylglycine-generating enzyme required for sulfatase activity/serine/threonine protein kinase